MTIENIFILQIVGSGRNRKWHCNQKELEDSIKELGILTPLVVRKLQNGSYELIDGQSRLKAAKSIDLERVPCQVVEITDEQLEEVDLISSVKRIETKPNEYGNQLHRLMASNQINLKQLAKKLRMPYKKVKQLYDKRDL